MARYQLIGVAALAPVILGGAAAGQTRPAVPGEARQFSFDLPGVPEAPSTADARALGAWRPVRAGPAESAALFSWAVQPADDAHSAPGTLVVRAAGSGAGIALAMATELAFRDVAVAAWVRPEASATAGVAWRLGTPTGAVVRDGYLAGWSPSDGAFRVLVLQDGRTREIARTTVSGRPGTWRAISIAHVGRRIEAVIDGSSRLTVEDSTWPAEGAGGVWAEGPAVAFDDVSLADVTPPATTPRESIVLEARSVAPLVESELARAFLSAAEALPAVPGSRTVWHDRAAGKAYTGAEAEALTEERRSGMRELTLDERFYYLTRYGTPVAYARALDLAAKHGLSAGSDRRVLDFGYGGIGHLRMLASLGVGAVGVDVDPVLAALYSRPEDTGEVPRFAPSGRAVPDGPKGRVTLVHGSWPGEEAVRSAVAAGGAGAGGAGDVGGAGYDLFISKNTLKNGYLHPAEKVDPRMLVNLGVSDREFVQRVFESLRPGGVMLIYNICPAPSVAPAPYKPWADGRSPFPREMLEAAGFEVRAFDVVDDQACRAQARAMGWDRGDQKMDVEGDLFAWYTIAVRPGGKADGRGEGGEAKAGGVRPAK